MISQVSGLVVEKTTHSVVLDVQGIGYEIEVPVSTAFGLPEQGASAKLFTHFVVREDAQLLFGFARRQERDTFRTLIKVNGVGPKVAVSILSVLDGDALAHCVESDNVGALVKVPGIGKKTAERLIVELRGKLSVASSAQDGEAPSLAMALPEEDASSEAEAALEALGYKNTEAAKLVKKVFSPGMDAPALIKAALQSLHK